MLSFVAVSGLLATPYFAAAMLLAVSGSAKLWRPGSAMPAMHAAGLPSSVPVARLLGAVELAIGLGCLIAPRTGLSVALAVAYLGFAWFLVKLLRLPHPLSSCGCVGASDAPATRLHVFVDLGASLAGLIAAARPLPGLFPYAADQGSAGLPIVVGVAVTAYLVHLALAFLPAAMASFSSRSPERGSPSSRPQAFGIQRATVPEEP
jgi:hypothetical protein